MDRRFDTRLSDMLAQAQVPPDLIDGLLSRLETFVLSFTASLREPEQRRHTVEYLTGLLSRLAHKTGEGIAYPMFGVEAPGSAAPARKNPLFSRVFAGVASH